MVLEKLWKGHREMYFKSAGTSKFLDFPFDFIHVSPLHIFLLTFHHFTRFNEGFIFSEKGLC